MIYLQAKPETLKKRIAKKNVAIEDRISDEYLEEVVKAYEHFFFHYKSSDLLVIETSEIDFVDRNEDLQELLRRLSQPVKGTQYFLPLGSAPRTETVGDGHGHIRARPSSVLRQPNLEKLRPSPSRQEVARSGFQPRASRVPALQPVTERVFLLND